ncbi:MAG: hypothetical protein KGH88_09345, partial [Thaumarchaeota archaeon]|nr:hypothetical protein [Nitrososphaerota archaeon]
LDLEDSAYGKIISVHSKRENIQQLIYYLDDAMVYVACDPLTSAKNMAEISDRIGELLGKLQYYHKLQGNKRMRLSLTGWELKVCHAISDSGRIS